MAKKRREWQKIPLSDEILLNLMSEENRGEMLTTDLYRKLKLEFPNLTHSDLMDELFHLEVRGFVHVIQIKKNVSKIEINRNANLTQEIREKIRNYIH